MRILTVGNMYPPHSLGGYELVWQSFVRNALAHGHEVRVLTTDVVLPEGEGKADTEDVHRDLRWYWADHGWPRHGLRQRLAVERANARSIDDSLATFRPDAVMWWSMAGLSISVIERVRRAGIPSVAVLDDFWFEYADAVDQWQALFRGRRRRLAPLARALTGQIVGVDMATGVTAVFTSDVVREGAVRRWPQLEADLVVIRHAPPGLERFALAPPRPWGWRLLCVGRIVEEKGVDLAVEALALLPDEATLHIDGSGDAAYLATLRRRIGELGLEHRVTIVRSPREELPAVYADADVTLFPVRWREPFGLVPLESIAVGRPVVASGRGGTSEFLTDGESFLVADPDDGPEALAARIRELAGDPDLRDRLRAGGLAALARIADERFDDAVLALVERVGTARRG